MNIYIKLISALLIILGGGYIGNLLSQKFSVRAKQLKQFNKVLSQMNFNIVFLQMPLVQAIEWASKVSDGAISKVLSGMADSMQRQNITPLNAFLYFYKEYKNKFCLTKEDEDILHEFMLNLGTGDAEHEKNNVNLACAKLTVAQTEAEGEKIQKGKLWRGLGFLGGIFVVIILF